MITIPDFYSGRSVFITGVTGFLGKVLMEKLLRSCPGISKIYVLIRPKRGVDAQTRLDKVLDSKVGQMFKKKLLNRSCIPGSICLPLDNIHEVLK